jgi:hypothetical protein
MAERHAEQQPSKLEQWLEQEFEQAIGGEHIIERLRKTLHERYADDPAVRRIIDRIAAKAHQRIGSKVTP